MQKLIVVIAGIFFSSIAFSQSDSTKAPYQRFPTYPPVKLLMPDSTHYFTKADLPKKKAVMLVLFNPACDHCQHETEEIIKNIDGFKKITIVMASNMPLSHIRTFIEKYHLSDYDNIIVAQDTQYFLPSFYMAHNLPYLAFYNKQGELISTFEGSLPIEKVLEELINKNPPQSF